MQKILSKKIAVVCLSVSLVVGSISTSAEIYRWVDDNGQVHYTDAPQPNKGSKVELDITAPPAIPDEGELRRRALLERAEVEAEHKSAIEAENKAPPPVAPVERCLPARFAWYSLTQELPIYWSDAGEIRAAWHSDPYQGGRRYIDEDERQQLMSTTTQKINQHCPNGETDNADGSDYQRWLRIDDCIVSKAVLEEAKAPKARTTKGKLKKLGEDVQRICG